MLNPEVCAKLVLYGIIRAIAPVQILQLIAEIKTLLHIDHLLHDFLDNTAKFKHSPAW